jgi:hypothetical protein
MWAGPAQINTSSSAQGKVGRYRPKMVGPISTQNIFLFSFLGQAGPSPDTWAGPTLAWPKCNVNYLQNVNSGSCFARNRNGCRK